MACGCGGAPHPITANYTWLALTLLTLLLLLLLLLLPATTPQVLLQARVNREA
jgi:hypothetical protein